jgi:hypothetical protein
MLKSKGGSLGCHDFQSFYRRSEKWLKSFNGLLNLETLIVVDIFKIATLMMVE